MRERLIRKETINVVKYALVLILEFKKKKKSNGDNCSIYFALHFPNIDAASCCKNDRVRLFSKC